MNFKLPKLPKFKKINFKTIINISLVLIGVISLFSLIFNFMIMSKLNFSFSDLLTSKPQNAIQDEVTPEIVRVTDSESLRTMIEELKKKDAEFERSLQGVRASNSNVITTAEACKLFVYNYFLFFEKANELFANGTTGCANRYIESKNPERFPNGCYRIDSPKRNFQNLRGWYQNPDEKYYNALKKFYDGYKKYQSECLKKLN